MRHSAASKPNPVTNVLGDTESHESYGMVEISRYTCNPPQNFFGSSVRHHSGISLRIHKAIKRRSLAEDRYFAQGTIIEVDMSAAQFADMVCSPNIVYGVPCTLRFLAMPEGVPLGKPLAPCPEESVRQRIQEDFEEKMEAMTKEMVKLTEQTKAILGQRPGSAGGWQINLRAAIAPAVNRNWNTPSSALPSRDASLQ